MRENKTKILWMAVTVLISLVPILFWHAHNSAYPLNWDSAHYLNDAFSGYQKLKQEGAWEFLKSAIFYDRHWRATLTPVVLSPLLFIFQGKIILTSLITNVVLLITLTIALFKTNKLYLNNIQSSLLTIAIINTPWVFGSGFYYMSELLYFSFSAWCIYFWLQSNHGENAHQTKRSLIFFTLALLTRPLESLLFLGLLYLISILKSMQRKKLDLNDLALFFISLLWLILHLLVDFYYDLNFNNPTLKLLLFIEAITAISFLAKFLKDKSQLLYSLSLAMLVTFSWYFLESKKFIGWLMLSTFGSVSNFQSEFRLHNVAWNPLLKLVVSLGLFPLIIMLLLATVHFFYRSKKLVLPLKIIQLSITACLLPLIGLVTNNDETRLYFANFIFMFWGVLCLFLMNFKYAEAILILPIAVYFNTNLNFKAAPGFEFKKELTMFGFSPHIWPPREGRAFEDFFGHVKKYEGRVFFFMTEPLERGGLINEINPLILTVAARERGLNLNFEDLINREYDSADFDHLKNVYSYVLLGPDFEKMRFMKKAYGAFAVKLFSDPVYLTYVETFQVAYKGQSYLFSIYKLKH